MLHYVLAKYGEISHMTTFRTEIIDLRRGEKIVLRSDRGTELGQVVHPPYESEQPPVPAPLGEVLRRATPEDLAKVRHVDEVERPAALKYANEKIGFHQLPMKLVDVEYVFGGEKIIFYFLAEGRVDFRQLVKDLAKEYRTRIELKQIGVRDEARVLADFDHCGREICCRMFIRDLEPVTMKMAKAQKATLDPSKISGRCGRLMCCLRYEDQVYEEMRKSLPKRGSRVVLERGSAEVIDYDVMSQSLRVEGQDGRIVKVSMKDVKQVIPRDEKEWQKKQQERAQWRMQQQQQAQAQANEARNKRRVPPGVPPGQSAPATPTAPQAAASQAPQAPASQAPAPQPPKAVAPAPSSASAPAPAPSSAPAPSPEPPKAVHRFDEGLEPEPPKPSAPPEAPKDPGTPQQG